MQESLHLTLSWRKPLSCRNQSTDFQNKSMDWFLYDNGLHQKELKPDWFSEMKLLQIYFYELLAFSQCIYFIIFSKHLVTPYF